MNDPATLRIIAGWLLDLSRLVRHTEEKPTKDQLAVYATMLAKDLPSGAFTSDSLHQVASGMSFWPDFAVLRRQAVEWWREHRPPNAPLLGYDGERAAVLSTLDQAWLNFYNRRIGEIVSGPPGNERRANLASLLRQHSPEAWKLINGEPVNVAPPTEEDFRRLRAVLAEAIGPMSKPLDDAMSPSKPTRRLAVLTAEQLAQTRAEAAARMVGMAAMNVR